MQLIRKVQPHQETEATKGLLIKEGQWMSRRDWKSSQSHKEVQMKDWALRLSGFTAVTDVDFILKRNRSSSHSDGQGHALHA